MTRKPSYAPRLSALRFFAGSLAVVVTILYLAGYFFLWSMQLDPYHASPLTIPRYAYHYGHEPNVRMRLAWSAGAASAVIGIAGILVLHPKRRSLHGDARWARRQEIASAGLLAENGIILGRYKNKLLTLGGQQGVILAAPPRSGKGVGVVIPNLLNWPGSVICLDIKQENWKLTAGYRAQFGSVFLFDPFAIDGRTACWNPLDYVSPNPHHRIDDLQRIAAMLCVEERSGDSAFWVKSARSLFVGIALYLFERRDYERAYNAETVHTVKIEEVPVTIGEILRQAMASDEEGFEAHWKRVVEGWEELGKPLSPACVALLMDAVKLAGQTSSSIRKTFTSHLDLWLNPLLDLATSSSDFDLRDLRKRKMSIYLGVKPRDFERLQTVMNLFFQQAIGEQTAELPEFNPALKHQLLVVLDEFTAVGRIPILMNSIAFVPGYNVRTLMVIQTPSQLNEVYGQHGAKIMLKTLAARLVFAPNDIEDARQISEELGYRTVKSKSRTLPGIFSGAHRNPSVSISDQRRALLLPQEVKEMGPDRIIVLYENLRPVLARKIRYYSDKRFTARILPAPNVQARDVASAQRARMDDHFDLWRTHARQNERHSVRLASEDVKAPHTIPDADAPALDEFSLDFSRVEVPAGRPLTPEELTRAVNRFLDELETA